ncbi:MAG: ParA family protein, partial [Candidatus Competibacteraceae bacterium]|nr:ParA family protein [Candidatus Competibacteraceae bacterium]
MPVYIGMVSQKGGVTKSTLARLIAREYAVGGWAVKIADLDVSQGTSYDWQARRLEAGITPEIPVERFSSVDAALKATGQYNLVVFDGAPHSTAGTKRIAQVSDVVILPTGPSLDDLKPTVLLAHSLVKEGVDRSKLYFALCRVGDSEAEITEARDYLTQAGYQVLEAAIP